MKHLGKVKKKSGKPFKSGKKINTVIGICINEGDPNKRMAFVFADDNSCVNICLCEEIIDNKGE